MSLTLSATFNDATGTVLLTATATTDHAAGEYTLTRIDAKGTAPVRTQAGLGFSAGALVVNDHEAALGDLVTYTLAADGETSVEVSLHPITARTWLKVPLLPQYSLELPAIGADYEGAWVPNDTIFDPLLRDEPIVVLGAFGLRRGRFTILCDSHSDALAVAAAYRRTRVTLLQIPDPAAASMYHIVSNLSVRKAGTDVVEYLVTGDYREVGRPQGDVLGTLGWSYADTTALATTYGETADTFPTYLDRTLGQ